MKLQPFFRAVRAGLIEYLDAMPREFFAANCSTALKFYGRDANDEQMMLSQGYSRTEIRQWPLAVERAIADGSGEIVLPLRPHPRDKSGSVSGLIERVAINRLRADLVASQALGNEVENAERQVEPPQPKHPLDPAMRESRRKYLLIGAQARIAKQFGVSRQLVSLVVHGKSRNEAVATAWRNELERVERECERVEANVFSATKGKA